MGKSVSQQILVEHQLCLRVAQTIFIECIDVLGAALSTSHRPSFPSVTQENTELSASPHFTEEATGSEGLALAWGPHAAPEPHGQEFEPGCRLMAHAAEGRVSWCVLGASHETTERICSVWLQTSGSLWVSNRMGALRGGGSHCSAPSRGPHVGRGKGANADVAAPPQDW